LTPGQRPQLLDWSLAASSSGKKVWLAFRLGNSSCTDPAVARRAINVFPCSEKKKIVPKSESAGRRESEHGFLAERCLELASLYRGYSKQLDAAQENDAPAAKQNAASSTRRDLDHG
jgi:hypothetical protein